MMKHPFIIFIGVITLVVGCAVWFIQGPEFAAMAKKTLAKYVPHDTGIEGDFKEFRIKLFPPGLAVTDPHVEFKDHNTLGIPGGSKLRASRIELKFYPLQMLSGAIRVNEVGIIGGEADIILPDLKAPARKTKGQAFELSWKDLFQVKLDAVSFEDSLVHLQLPNGDGQVDFEARKLMVRQSTNAQGPEFELTAETSKLKAALPKFKAIPASMDEINLQVTVNSKGVTIKNLQLVDRQDGKTNLLEASGWVSGDVMKPKSLEFVSQLSLSGDAPRLIGLTKLKLPLQGQIKFTGKISGDLTRIPESLVADGVVEGKQVVFRQWEVENASATLKWSGSGSEGGSALQVQKAELSSPERPRIGGTQAGGGGVIRAGTFFLPLQKLSSSEPVDLSVPLEFERAHIHWIAAPALSGVYPLDFRVSGKVGVQLLKAKKGAPLEIHANTDLKILGFQLDNQRLGKHKTLKKVLDVPEIRLSGPIVVDDKAVRPDGLNVDVGATHFVADGKISFETGYDLTAKGTVDLKEIGTIAENPIQGNGPMTVKVHGPTNRVFIDFDADLKDAFYLNLHLGDLKGRITWDDDPQNLIFSKVQLLKGQTAYMGDGTLYLGDKDSIDLSFDFARADAPGNVQDLIQIFQELTKSLWWYPTTLAGPAYGKVTVTGGVGLDKLVVTGDLKGSNWEYLREKFRSVAARLMYDKGKYVLQNFKAIKNQGSIQGEVSYVPDGDLIWNLKTSGFQLTDFDHFNRLNAPARASLAIESTGSGKLSAVKSDTQLSVTDYFVRGVELPSSQARLETGAGIAQMSATLLGRQGLMDLKYGFKPGSPSRLRLAADRLDLTPLMLLLSPRLVQDMELAGNVSGEVDLQFKSGSFESASGTVALTEALAQKTGFRLQLIKGPTVEVRNGSFDTAIAEFKGSSGDVVARLSAHNTLLDGSMYGNLDSGVLEFFTPEVLASKGRIDLDFGLSGTIKDPSVTGKLSFDSLYAKLDALDQPIENISGTVQLRRGVLSVQYLNADLATGRLAVSGTVTLFADRYPELDLRANLIDNKIAIFPFQYAKIRGKLQASGSAPPYKVDGEVLVDGALSKENVLNRVRDQGRKSVRYMPTSSSAEGSPSIFALNIHSHADHGIVVNDDLFDAELKGDVTLVNTIDAPRLLGKAEVIQGKMLFKDHSFQIQSGEIIFDNPTIIDPKFNLTANTEINNTHIRLYAYGTMSKIKVDLSSNPALPEEQILSLLAIGVTNDDVNRLRAADKGMLQQGEAASLLLYSLDFNREVQEKTGLRIQVEESVDTQTGTSIFRPQPTGADPTSAAPKIVIKRSLGKNVDLSVGSTVGVGTSIEREVNAEVKVTPAISVIGVWDAFEGLVEEDSTTSYGVDLRLQKRFR